MTSGTSKHNKQHLPGNDGAWFLKAVGQDAPPTDLDDVSGDNTTEMVRELWAAKTSDDSLAGWAPDELSATVERQRSFRWPMVIGGVLLTLAVVALGVWLPTTSERRALAVADDYRVSLSAIRVDLPDVQEVLAAVTEPDADATQFPELTPVITDLSTDASVALEVAAEPIPQAWPLGSQEPFDELVPFRDEVSIQATSAQAIARRIGDVLGYRTLFAGFLDVADLPTSGANLSELSSELATAAADSASIIGELPQDAALAAHKAAAQDALERFIDWQVEYVNALRQDDADAVEALLTELNEAKVNLNVALVTSLAQIRSEVDGEIIELAASIDITLAALPR